VRLSCICCVRVPGPSAAWSRSSGWTSGSKIIFLFFSAVLVCLCCCCCRVSLALPKRSYWLVCVVRACESNGQVTWKKSDYNIFVCLFACGVVLVCVLLSYFSSSDASGCVLLIVGVCCCLLLADGFVCAWLFRGRG
jgi:hypothetical protein